MVGEDIRTRAALNFSTVCAQKTEIVRLNKLLILKDLDLVRSKRNFDQEK
jgi:hypothetical protein